MLGLGVGPQFKLGGGGTTPVPEPSATQQRITANYGSDEVGTMLIPIPSIDGQQILWQDDAMTVPASADTDPVRVIHDLSTGTNHGVASSDAGRVQYRTDGTLHWLQPNGVDQFLVIDGFVGGLNAFSFSVAFETETTETTWPILMFLGDASDAPTNLSLIAPHNNPGDYMTRLVGDTDFDRKDTISTGANSEVPHVITAFMRLGASGVNRHDVDGGTPEETTFSTTVTEFTNHSLRLFSGIGSQAWPGRFFGLILREGEFSTQLAADNRAYLSDLAGIS